MVASGLLFGAAGIARADPVSIPTPDWAVANPDDSCGNDLSSCDSTARKSAPLPPAHVHKEFSYHRFAKRRPPVVAARQHGAEEIALQQLPCTGVSAWSLLCPGTQIIGISY
jgi:hypothetical protein